MTSNPSGAAMATADPPLEDHPLVLLSGATPQDLSSHPSLASLLRHLTTLLGSEGQSRRLERDLRRAEAAFQLRRAAWLRCESLWRAIHEVMRDPRRLEPTDPSSLLARLPPGPGAPFGAPSLALVAALKEEKRRLKSAKERERSLRKCWGPSGEPACRRCGGALMGAGGARGCAGGAGGAGRASQRIPLRPRSGHTAAHPSGGALGAGGHLPRPQAGGAPTHQGVAGGVAVVIAAASVGAAGVAGGAAGVGSLLRRRRRRVRAPARAPRPAHMALQHLRDAPHGH
ncbi:uncharacterized protein LOC128850150 isoform X3 [Cuculus canorus]|uniref:uncharacterized protein LOC128850150 isoform X3 n=1 Tax=Cuculus canorus TaxID=55661 RepID=UPI0023AAEC95|nr:uncharacterized protein LOC128850150 isoform X3 [Cuculus canorus]